jgi:bile acid:Na+ symporter, BASS family
VTAILLLGLKASVVSLILAIGLSATLGDLLQLLRRPGPLLRALLAMYVVVPAAGFILVRMVDLPEPIEVALLVLAVSAGAPLLPRKLRAIGGTGYMLSLVAISSIVAVFAVPIWIEALKPLYAIGADVAPLDVAKAIARAFVAPLLIGMLVHRQWPETAAQLSEWILAIGSIALGVCSLALIGLHGELLLEIGWPSLLALAAMTLIALAIGHALGGPEETERTALAVACATRHVGIAVLVAATVPGARAAVLVTAYILVAALVSVPYLRLRTARAARQA